MTQSFDPKRALVFDLARGQLRDEEGHLRLNLPAALVLRLCEGAGEEATRDFASSLGAEMGRKLEQSLGADTESASLEQWAELLGAHLALLGLGDLRIERWGQALVFRVEGVIEELQGLVGVVLESAIRRALGRELTLLGFAEEQGAVYLAVSKETVPKVYALAEQGEGIAGVIFALHRGAQSASPGAQA